MFFSGHAQPTCPAETKPLQASLWWWCHSVQPAGLLGVTSLGSSLTTSPLLPSPGPVPKQKNPREVSEWLCQHLADKCQPRLQHLSCTRITVLFQHCRLLCSCFSSFLIRDFPPSPSCRTRKPSRAACEEGWLPAWVFLVRKALFPNPWVLCGPQRIAHLRTTSWQRS